MKWLNSLVLRRKIVFEMDKEESHKNQNDQGRLDYRLPSLRVCSNLDPLSAKLALQFCLRVW